MERMVFNEAVLDPTGGAGAGASGAPPQGGNNSGGGNGTPPPGNSGAAGANADKTAEALKAIYGDISPQFPEGLPDDVKIAPSVKPFVDKDGKINIASILKSYVETKKMVGTNKVELPSDKTPEEEVAAFWEKLGWAKDPEKYALQKSENSKLDDAFLKEFKEMAHKARIPVGASQELLKFLEKKVDETGAQESKAFADKVNSDIAALKTEFGVAYDYKVGLAKRLLTESLSDKEKEMFKDPAISSNPAVIKTLVRIAERVYKEDGFAPSSGSNGALTPSEASARINEIMADKKGPYWNRQDPRHGDIMKEMEQLHRWKNAVR